MSESGQSGGLRVPRHYVTTERVSVAEAAATLGVGEQCVRERMKRGIWDLGMAEKSPGPNGRWRYLIFRPKLDALVGRPVAAAEGGDEAWE